MIVILALIAGLAMRLATGNRLSDLAHVKLRGEQWLLGLLVVQMVLPGVRLQGLPSDLAYVIWCSTFPLMIVVVLANRRQPGMYLIAAGLLLNMIVIYANRGMPVDPTAVALAKPGAVTNIPSGDFVHVAWTSTILLPWLGDVLPVVGPSWLRSVASPGDCLLVAGIAAYLACSIGIAGPLQT